VCKRRGLTGSEPSSEDEESDGHCEIGEYLESIDKLCGKQKSLSSRIEEL
jgi:hypothetical protein